MGQIIEPKNPNARFNRFIKKVEAINIAIGAQFGPTQRAKAVDAWFILNAGKNTRDIDDTCLAVYSDLD